MRSIHTSTCRACMNSCPTLVEVDDGRLHKVVGDPANPIFDGYSCVKGRAQPALHNHPDRLLKSLKRRPDGTFVTIDSGTAMDEIAEKLLRILDEHGPRSFACYIGTGVSGNCLTDPLFNALLHAVGSKMKFSPNTIDKPGKSLALAMHGSWGAPLQGYHAPDVALVIGANPFRSYYGTACGHPGKWLGEQLARGMELLVIDPRRSDLAKRARLHLQPRPGHDPAILACLINIVLTQDLFDHRFLDDNARGVEELRRAVSPFTPTLVAASAGVQADTLTDVARRFARPARGYAVCGTGPGFASSSTLVEYLVLVLETLCGHWLREGERVARTTTLMRSGPYRAQASDPIPAYGLGEVLRVGGLTQTAAGMPTGALPDEILLEGEGKVQALFSAGGNPVVAWPDQLRTIEALRSLDLFVQIDPWMSATARLADYVIAPTMTYEEPGMTLLTDFIISLPTYYGPAEAHAQYTDAVATPPERADVMAEWKFVYRLAKRMGLPLEIRTKSLTPAVVGRGIPLDMEVEPTAEDLLEALAADGRVSLDEVKLHPSGAPFREPPLFVGPKEPGWTGRFDLANGDMVTDLAAEERAHPHEQPFRLISVRVQHMFNSTINDPAFNRGRGYNPALLHPLDLRRLALEPGDVVEITSERATIRAIVQADADLREGVVAMAHGFGDGPDRDAEFREIGSSPARLLDASWLADPYVGMPRIGGIPVDIRACR